MPVLTTIESERGAVATAFADQGRLVVVSLCADWCDTCKEFRGAFEAIANARPNITFVWLDIEDDSAVAGDIDVENFPTLAIYRGDSVMHFGVSLPQEGTVARLVDEMAERTTAVSSAPEEVRELPALLKNRAQAN
ncbi:MAG: thioredoxin family protein [Betaproteobacteria bacterium]|nr:MAG: thioredoxin family protein [Betaproteobacteria bacterium]TMH64513.1 MAG: thioredoxin family protein [Betaproteobacteria bacterium]